MNANEYRKIREKLGLSQVALAKSVGVTNKTISNRETGAKPITKEAEISIHFLHAKELRKEFSEWCDDLDF